MTYNKHFEINMKFGVFRSRGSKLSESRRYGKDTLHVLAENGPMHKKKIASLVAKRNTPQPRSAHVLSNLDRKEGHFQKLAKREYISIIPRKTPFDLDVIVPEFKGMIAAIYSDIVENNTKKSYLLYDHSHLIEYPLKRGFIVTKHFPDYLNWINHHVNNKKFFKYLTGRMNKEYNEMNFDYISNINVINFYNQCFREHRDKLIAYLCDIDIISDYKTADVRELVINTLKWMEKTGYKKDDFDIIYWIKSLKYISYNNTYIGYFTEYFMP